MGGIDPPPQQQTFVQAGYIDTSVSPSVDHYGEKFIGGVVVPTIFGPDSGGWSFLQIVSLNRSHYYPTDALVDAGLDNEWPYNAVPDGETLPTWGAPAAGTLSGATHAAVDSPETSNKSFEVGYSIGDTYEMSLMFRPPGQDCQYVRIHKFVWGWSGSDHRANSQTFWADPPPCSILNISSAHDTMHPTWSHRVVNQNG